MLFHFCCKFILYVATGHTVLIMGQGSVTSLINKYETVVKVEVNSCTCFVCFVCLTESTQAHCIIFKHILCQSEFFCVSLYFSVNLSGPLSVLPVCLCHLSMPNIL